MPDQISLRHSLSMAEDPSSSAAPSPAIPDPNSLKTEPLNNNNNDNPTSQPGAKITPTPSITSYSQPPSFRPVAAQFYQNHSFGVGVPPMMAPYQVQPGFQTPRPPYTPIPNGYQGTIAPPPGGLFLFFQFFIFFIFLIFLSVCLSVHVIV